MNYALIEDGVVANIIWLYPATEGDFPNAVRCADIPVAIGDTYADGVFYRDGERVLSAAEVASAEADDMRSALELLGVKVDE